MRYPYGSTQPNRARIPQTLPLPTKPHHPNRDAPPAWLDLVQSKRPSLGRLCLKNNEEFRPPFAPESMVALYNRARPINAEEEE